MLIRKGAAGSQNREAPPQRGAGQTDRERMESLLRSLEKNLRLETFFIGRREFAELAEILPAQGDLLQAVVDLAEKIPLSGGEASELNRRLAAASGHRQRNQKLLDESIAAAKAELDEMNGVRRRLQQMKAISKNIYADPEPSKLENWA
jgi:hypothetical protein